MDALRAAGYDVASIARESPGLSDPAVLARALAEDRVVITFDRDFGELIFARGESGRPGVLLLRFVPASPTEPAALLSELLDRPDIALAGFFTVVYPDHVRQRRLPSSPSAT